MAITDDVIQQAEARVAAERDHAHAIAARYDRRTNRVIVSLHTGLELALPPHLVEGLADATPDALSEIEISPSGLGLHWPQLDADLYVPALLEGQFGTKEWMARQLGAAGGKSRSPAKSNAARANGLKGGRPRIKRIKLPAHQLARCHNRLVIGATRGVPMARLNASGDTISTGRMP